MKKISWVVVPQTPQDGVFGWQEVIAKMKDGNVYTCKVEHPRGEPQNPLTREQHAAKYRNCALHAHYAEADIARIKELIFDLENVKDISQLMELTGKSNFRLSAEKGDMGECTIFGCAVSMDFTRRNNHDHSRCHDMLFLRSRQNAFSFCDVKNLLRVMCMPVEFRSGL
jgi:hypothetical protein